MTLILSTLTENNLIQVSDRRFMSLDGTLVEDDRNKSLIWQGSLRGFTGIASLGPERSTPLWLAHILSRQTDLQAALAEVARQATVTFASLPLERH